MSHDNGRTCVCVTVHRPQPVELHAHHVWPKSEGGPADGELLWLCPTTHVNVHELWREYDRAAGTPVWEVRARFSPYCRGVVARGWVLARTLPGVG